ncbi:hypothetical protein BABINDRAFT_161885 [Babjeviella inositovora NRRL Y-12698]|uniref:ATP synthase subunit gamma n=1 Tax=Babjeviella inositovora NRRL Y-12698 TaxID=984486 RepID=A0A1E3QPC5_9ASCO|nr:uncharacterized protein BABINDRAFT_161885 [Babjeviella inositovora NRRL Y-12698]ODQ79488.1 hypothetical protein BABINDRAFT_161885 [Babjeviella inositovora NRRL Y-12698]
MFRLGTNAVRGAAGAQARNYATLREIEMRLKSIKNIEKITKTMKIVASTKLNKAQIAMNSGRVYQGADTAVYKHAETAATTEPTKSLIVSITSDKGLCGSIHSQVAKATRNRINSLPGTVSVVAIGDKIKQQIMRTHADSLVLAVNGVGKDTPTFSEAAAIADAIKTLGEEYDQVEIIYNKFVSGVSFTPEIVPIFSASAIEASPLLSSYDLDIDAKTPETLSEFSLANAIYAAMAEGHAAEISARRNAMDNASKNASEIINKLGILYNRTRQAVITNELVDIITGASSLD